MSGEGILHFVEYELQIIALSWMALLYMIRIYQISRLPMPWERDRYWTGSGPRWTMSGGPRKGPGEGGYASVDHQ